MSDWDRTSNDVTAKLGCGTLIVIAIIVAMFSQSGRKELESDVNRLRGTVEELQGTIRLQTTEIRDLGERIDSLIALGSR